MTPTSNETGNNCANGQLRFSSFVNQPGFFDTGLSGFSSDEEDITEETQADSSGLTLFTENDKITDVGIKLRQLFFASPSDVAQEWDGLFATEVANQESHWNLAHPLEMSVPLSLSRGKNGSYVLANLTHGREFSLSVHVMRGGSLMAIKTNNVLSVLDLFRNFHNVPLCDNDDELYHTILEAKLPIYETLDANHPEIDQWKFRPDTTWPAMYPRIGWITEDKKEVVAVMKGLMGYLHWVSGSTRE